MIGMRVMQHEDGRAFLRGARSGRLANAEEKDFARVMRDESRLLGFG